jgi:hypothetical protein
VTTDKPPSGEELLPRREPTKFQLAETIARLADENARLREENAQLREENAQLREENAQLREERRAYILDERDGSGKSTLEWINNARLAAAHFALTQAGQSYDKAADLLIQWRPKIRDLLEGNRRATSFTAKDRLIQLWKNLQSGRATRNEGGLLAYRYARRVISRHKSDPDELEQLAVRLILAIDLR